MSYATLPILRIQSITGNAGTFEPSMCVFAFLAALGRENGTLIYV